MIKIVECPRDAMQGIAQFIPTQEKARYINQLLKVGFDTIDFGSFVSPKTIPQMKDTAEVLSMLELNAASKSSKLLAIVANMRGAEQAASFEEINYLGFPFSISETFQKRNTNTSIEASLELLTQMQSLCVRNKKELVVYVSMGFGNPYGDPWNTEIVAYWVEKLVSLDIKTIALADTVGVSKKETIAELFSFLIPTYKQIEFGAHLHANANNATEKIAAALSNGCRRFDTAIMGFGGCPMAEDHLTGNIATESLIDCLAQHNYTVNLDASELNKAITMATEIFL
jgi:hydroxymethylglutaryl-CoA lyase